MHYILLRVIVLMALVSTALTGCAKEFGTSAVSVSAINYTDQELNGYLFESVDGSEKYAGGEPVRPFQGGGVMCCFSLPDRWRPGIKVRVQYDWWQGEDQPRKYEHKEVEVAPYPDGQVGTLWALFYPDGSLEVVSSDFAPGHPKWPGKVKGWPVPTVEHRRRLWQEEYDLELANAKDFLRVATQPTDKDFLESWIYHSKDNPSLVAGMSGATDPNFIAFIKGKFKKAYEDQQAILKRMESRKP